MEGRPKRSSTIEKDYTERKRSRKASSGEEKFSQEEQVSHTLLEKLYKEIINLKDPEDDEYELSALFLELPLKKEYPDYYQIIKHPIALENMKAKIDAKEYKSMSQFKADIDLMVSNAKKYNTKESEVYEDATKIQKYVKAWNGPKEKAIVKLPAEAFAQHAAPTKIKTIKLRAVDKAMPKSVNLKALMEAISRKESKRSLELLEQDPYLDPNELVHVEMFSDKFTWSPLHAACYYGDVKLADALMARGANVELNDTWYSATPLGWAAFGDKDKVVKLLVQKYNANTKAENIHGQVPFDVVSNRDDPRWIGLFKPSASPTQAAPPQLQQLQQKQQQSQQRLTIAPPQQIQIKQGGHAGPSSGFQPHMYQPSADGQPVPKRRGRPPKAETDAAAVRPTKEIDISTFDPVAFEIELFNAIRTHTDNVGRLYSELFEDLPDRAEYPDYYKEIKNPLSLTEIAEKMQTKQYPNLHSWMNDMRLVFENAQSYNEPGSRIFRDAKLLLRLLNRLKERILARLEVPVSQEDACFRISLTNRSFDVDALSEDKRKIKRLLANTNKSRTQSMEPEQMSAAHMPMPNHFLIQQQQQMMMQQQLMLQQQPVMPLPPQMQQPPLFDPNAFVTRPPVQPAPAALSPFPEVPSPKSPLGKASKEFYALFRNGGSFLNGMKLSSNDTQFNMSIDGDYTGHSITVPSQVNTLSIQPDFPKELRAEENRLSITVLQNNIRLSIENDEWKTASLVKGMNAIKINITANVTQDGSMPEFKSQVYHLFITQAW